MHQAGAGIILHVSDVLKLINIASLASWLQETEIEVFRYYLRLQILMSSQTFIIKYES